MTNWKEQFTNEFGIHFKDSAGELQFALAFIEDLLENTQDTNKPFNPDLKRMKEISKEWNELDKLLVLTTLKERVKERQRGWLGQEEDGSDRAPEYDECQWFITLIDQLLVTDKKEHDKYDCAECEENMRD